MQGDEHDPYPQDQSQYDEHDPNRPSVSTEEYLFQDFIDDMWIRVSNEERN